MVLNYHKDFEGLCIELKGLTNYYYVSVAQKEMKKWYVENGYAFILSNNYDKISKAIHEYMRGIRVPCKYCVKSSSLRKLEIRTNLYIWTNCLMNVCIVKNILCARKFLIDSSLVIYV